MNKFFMKPLALACIILSQFEAIDNSVCGIKTLHIPQAEIDKTLVASYPTSVLVHATAPLGVNVFADNDWGPNGGGGSAHNLKTNPAK